MHNRITYITMPHYLNNDEHVKLVEIICKNGNTRSYYPTHYCKFAKIKNHLNVLGVVFPTVFSILQITYRLDSLGIKKMGALHILCLVLLGRSVVGVWIVMSFIWDSDI